ncbi:MAG: DJ-1/PfpI family protein [Candidatus Pacebacteria bacterium]|jgi:protease I|nr:DJ-1/PfpI family protein [Candidatus Paceibacterota bacterium]MDD4994510.1 DJ-1/PfpI family protein [Candidatus Paceibacterota bacterium]MDD5535285.1 DJ-1/PfpI family protein [Candidatus Paceibacterota bacterium]
MLKKIIYSTVLILVIAGLILWSIPLSFFVPKEIKPTSQMIEGKKILLVIAFNDFQDKEYFVPKEVFEKVGFLVETVSTQKGLAKGIEGGEVIIDIKVDEVQTGDYEAVVFCGGPGMAKELDNEGFLKLSQNFYEKDKVVAAICVAPALLAKAGILENKKATVWSSSLNKDYIKILEENGGIYSDESIVISENIITANSPEVAYEFGQSIVDLFKK